MELVKLNKGFKDEFLDVWKVAFEGDEEFSNEICTHFFNQDNLWQYAYGWIDNDKLVSTYLSLDVEVQIRNKPFKGHYIDGLATLPVYRGKGLIHKQMLNDAKQCLKNNIPLMLVDPSRDSFYRKFGFEYAIDQHRITIDRGFCSNEDVHSNYTIKAGIIASNHDLQQAYKEMNEWFFKNSRYNEMKWPKCYEDIKYQRKDITIAVAYDERTKPSGYVLYSKEDQSVLIESYRYLNLHAFYALKKYLLALDTSIVNFAFTSIPSDFPIDLFLKDLGRPEKKLFFGTWISRMIRIIDFKSVLERVIEITPNRSICIHLIDDILVENQGFYTILPSGEVKKEATGNWDLSTTITDVVPLLTGLKSAKELYYTGKLQVNANRNIEQSFIVPTIIEEIQAILPKITTFSADDYLAP